MKNYKVTEEFKTQVAELLATQKFSTVFPYMNLVNREGFTYSEEELNSIVQFLGEFTYSSVAEFFNTLSTHVTVVDENTSEEIEQVPGPESLTETVEETNY